eukprot:scaffold29871_cov40-Cyclotella_meneghiniana.AAC.4
MFLYPMGGGLGGCGACESSAMSSSTHPKSNRVEADVSSLKYLREFEVSALMIFCISHDI